MLIIDWLHLESTNFSNVLRKMGEEEKVLYKYIPLTFSSSTLHSPFIPLNPNIGLATHILTPTNFSNTKQVDDFFSHFYLKLGEEFLDRLP